ncbi:helix-turn-helix domain-containing protein [Arcobacter cryaerophilus gv. pseudocryaerophilus]
MKNIDFLLNKLRYVTNTKTDKELCKLLDISYSTLDTWKNNDKIPQKRLYEISQKVSISLDELIRIMNKELNSINDLIEERDIFLEKDINLFKDIGEELNFIEKKQVLESHCKKFNIQITEIKNLRILYLFEYLFKDVERINKVEELEEDIKKLMLKYDPRLAEDEQTRNLFYSFLEEQIKNFEDKSKV